jgi:V/A-type H+-transporting ATPase subunit B
MIVEGVEGFAYNEIVDIETPNGDMRRGQVLEVKGDVAVVQVSKEPAISTLHHQGTIHRRNRQNRCFIGHARTIFSGTGNPIDADLKSSPKKNDINGSPKNPSAREFPAEFTRQVYQPLME